MKVEFAIDTTPIDDEIETLKSLRVNVIKGYIETGRDDENRLVFRMTEDGKKAARELIKR